MEQAQVADTIEAVTSVGKPSSSDLFIFRPLAAVPPPPQRPSPKPGRTPPFLLRFRPVPAPPAPAAPAVRLKPQDPLLEPDEARFRQFLAQYRAFPTDGGDPAACLHFDLPAISIIYSLIAKSERGALAYGDLHQLELALLRVMPEAVLRGEARGRRARAAAPPFHWKMRSKLAPKDDAAVPIEALRAEMAALLDQNRFGATAVSPHAEAHAAAWQVSACWAFGSCVMGALGFVLIHLSSVPPGLAPAVPLLMALMGGAAAALTYIRRDHP